MNQNQQPIGKKKFAAALIYPFRKHFSDCTIPRSSIFFFNKSPALGRYLCMCVHIQYMCCFLFFFLCVAIVYGCSVSDVLMGQCERPIVCQSAGC